jgi:hypothetical protein
MTAVTAAELDKAFGGGDSLTETVEEASEEEDVAEAPLAKFDAEFGEPETHVSKGKGAETETSTGDELAGEDVEKATSPLQDGLSQGDSHLRLDTLSAPSSLELRHSIPQEDQDTG